LNEVDGKFLRLAYEQASKSFDEGGLPIGAALAKEGELVAVGHNRRVQSGDPIAHGEMDCLRRAGRRRDYGALTLYTTLSPCMMCTGTILQFGIPRVVIGEDRNFPGNPAFLREQGVDVVIADDPDCIALMARLIREKPELWAEDIAE
jgi:creatinine deaminase